jgi:hypothetical protein
MMLGAESILLGYADVVVSGGQCILPPIRVTRVQCHQPSASSYSSHRKALIAHLNRDGVNVECTNDD